MAKPCFSHGVPDGFEFQLFPDDWDQFGIYGVCFMLLEVV
jgi:hypothetical protein